MNEPVSQKQSLDEESKRKKKEKLDTANNVHNVIVNRSNLLSLNTLYVKKT